MDICVQDGEGEGIERTFRVARTSWPYKMVPTTSRRTPSIERKGVYEKQHLRLLVGLRKQQHSKTQHIHLPTTLPGLTLSSERQLGHSHAHLLSALQQKNSREDNRRGMAGKPKEPHPQKALSPLWGLDVLVSSAADVLPVRRASLPSAGFLLLGVVAPDTRGSVSWMPSDISFSYLATTSLSAL